MVNSLLATRSGAAAELFAQAASTSSSLYQYLENANVVPELTRGDLKLAAKSHFHQHDESGAQLAYTISVSAMVLIVVALYWQKGTAVVSRILAYLFALSTITLTIKNVYVNYGFKYPRFLSSVHLLLSGVVAFSVMLYRQHRDGRPIKIPLQKDFVWTIVPIAAILSCSIVVNNMALSYMGAGLVEMVSGCSPAFVFGIASAKSQSVNLKLLWPVLVVCLGTAMCAEGELRFSLIGMSLAMAATFLRAMKSTMQHSLMNEESRMDPVDLLAWLSIPSVLIMQTWSIATEGTRPYGSLYESASFSFYSSLTFSCINAAILNFSMLFVVRDLGAIGVTIVAQLKGILIILGGMAMLGEQVGILQCLGYATTVMGVFWFNSAEKMEKQLGHHNDLEKAPTIGETKCLVKAI
jgi:drug/metabolite transporter (DMT)-like permease